MKINTTKLVVGVLAVAGVASLVGSISGTVAWFQYNTRAVAEFEGITAKCTEFLEVRTVTAPATVEPDTILGTVANSAALPTVATNGDKYLGNDGNLYLYTTGTGWDNGTDVSGKTYAIKDAGYVKFSTNQWVEADEAYGNWTTRLTNADILTAAKRYNSSQANTASDAMSLSPVTVPATNAAGSNIGDEKDATLGTIYGSPICGYEQYATGTYHWSEAKSSSVAKFKLQFRVLDIDGKTVAGDKDPVMIAQDLYLTDLTVLNHTDNTTNNKQDITNALRFHVSTSAGNALLAPGDGTANTVTTDTHGALDLGGLTGNDTLLDVPNNYSFNAANTALDYGKDKLGQTAYDLNKKGSANDTNGLYPKNDGVGNLSGGKSFGKTVANPADTKFAGTYLTMTFTVFLEGWQKLGTTPSALWSSTDYIGAKFNIGMSFGVTALK